MKLVKNKVWTQVLEPARLVACVKLKYRTPGFVWSDEWDILWDEVWTQVVNNVWNQIQYHVDSDVSRRIREVSKE